MGCRNWIRFHPVVFFPYKLLPGHNGSEKVNANKCKDVREKPHNFYSSPNIITAGKPRRMKWARHIARMGEMRIIYKILVGKFKGTDHSEDLGVDGSIILEWILQK
jgi:hypothetical protein